MSLLSRWRAWRDARADRWFDEQERWMRYHPKSGEIPPVARRSLAERWASKDEDRRRLVEQIADDPEVYGKARATGRERE